MKSFFNFGLAGIAILTMAQVALTHRSVSIEGDSQEGSGKSFPQDFGPLYFYDADLIKNMNISEDGKSWTAGKSFGRLSPKKDIALPKYAEAFGLASDAIHAVAWAYPDPKYAEDASQTESSLFKKTGGYVYFGNCNQVVAVKGTVPGSRLLKFGPAEECPLCEFNKCPGQSGFMDYQEVTTGFMKPYASHYCWLPPNSCALVSPKSQDGCFAFKKKDAAGFLLFGVAGEQAPGGFPQSLGPFLLTSTSEVPPRTSLSQWSELRLASPSRMSLGMPAASTSLVWAYPSTVNGTVHLKDGGFVYGPGETVKRVVMTQYKADFAQATSETLQKAAMVCGEGDAWHKLPSEETMGTQADVLIPERVPGAKRYCWSWGLQEAFTYEMNDGSVIQFTAESP